MSEYCRFNVGIKVYIRIQTPRRSCNGSETLEHLQKVRLRKARRHREALRAVQGKPAASLLHQDIEQVRRDLALVWYRIFQHLPEATSIGSYVLNHVFTLHLSENFLYSGMSHV